MPKAESRSHTVHGASNFAALFGKEEESKPKTAPLQLPGLLGGRTLHFIRHCQGEHNATQAAGGTSQYLLDDAVLSSAGEAVARQLLSNPMFSTETGEQQLPELVVVSPLRRTIQTAVLGFGTDASFVLRPELQESSPMPCDCAKPELGVELLRRLGCDALRDEYEALPKDWHVKGAKWKATVLERFATLLKWLETRPERRIAIVGHHDFLRSNLGESFANGEVRTYVLEGGLLLGSSHEASARTKMGLRLSGFYRSPASSPSASSVDLAALDRAPRPFRFSLSGRSSLSSPRTSAVNSTRTSPAPSRNSSKNDLASFFSSAVSVGEASMTALRVKLPRGGEQQSPLTPPPAPAPGSPVVVRVA